MSKKELESSDASFDPSRRDFFKSTTLGATALIAGSGAILSGCSASANSSSNTQTDPSIDGDARARAAAELKQNLATQQLNDSLLLNDQTTNGDESRYADENFYASFHKSLPQNEFGEVDETAFQALQTAMASGAQSDFDALMLSNDAVRKLENPQGAFRYEMCGLDGHATRMAPAPAFRSAISAAEMGEVYWQALTRDVPYIDYSSDSQIDDAINDLNGFSTPVGPLELGLVNANTLFRGETPGDLVGPYISQLLLHDIPYGPSTIVQRYSLGVSGVDHMTDTANWLNIQRGGNPLETLNFEADQRYIYNNRALSEYVHTDVLFQAYFNAALIMLSWGPDALDRNNPYLSSGTQSAFTSLGGPWLLQLLSYAANLSLSGAWFQKWRVHRRLRPEVFAARIHFNQTGDRNYEIHSDILNCDAVDRVNMLNGNALMPMAYTEGSPRHPSYPAGHATIAGACCTILKAFFDEDFIIPTTVQPDATGSVLLNYTDTALTLGGEVNKLANNISLGRDAAGVHYRSDGIDGVEVGEQQAIQLLKEHVQTLNEDFSGLTLTKFNGETITISPNA